RVLVADSYEAARKPYVRYLQRFNFDVVEAADGAHLLELLEAKPPQAILSEWELPSMPAAQLAEWLAQRRLTRRIPLIVLANDVDPNQVPVVPHHIDGLLVKPFPLAQMLETLRQVLRAQL